MVDVRWALSPHVGRLAIEAVRRRAKVRVLGPSPRWVLIDPRVWHSVARVVMRGSHVCRKVSLGIVKAVRVGWPLKRVTRWEVIAGHHPRAVAHADCSMVLQTGYSNWDLAGCSTEHLAAHSSQGPLAAHPTCPHGCCSRVGNGAVHLGGVGMGVAQGAAVDPKGQLDEADQTKGACLAGSAHGGQDLEGQQLQDPGHLPRCHTLKSQASGWEACCHLAG